MKILDLNKSLKLKNLFSKDANNREINIHYIQKCFFTGKNNFYPNNLIYSEKEKKLFRPINEKVMSLSKLDKDDSFDFVTVEKLTDYNDPLFYFIYNTDNYYHFIYDTLPYLITYFELKKDIKNLKLLMNYPTKEKKEFYLFVAEFLKLLGIKNEEIIILDPKKKYDTVYISSSYTHGENSNNPPRDEVFKLYNKIKKIAPTNRELPKKIYVSRRSWLHKDFSNIGTNYTTRRKLNNEDQLVSMLEENGFTEVFTEKLSTIEKIQLFKNAEVVVGSIGGGLCNVLFSSPKCKLYTIVSPTFLEVNKRFIYCLNVVKNKLFFDTEHIDRSEFKINMRVKSNDIVGEIVNKDVDFLEIMFDDSPVSGWSNDSEYKKIKLHKSECIKLDEGLNSEYIMDLIKFKNFLK